MLEAPGERGVAVARQADRFCGEGGVLPLEHAMVQTWTLVLERRYGRRQRCTPRSAHEDKGS